MICPACGSTRVFPSRLRHAFERLRRHATDTQPFRCHDCGWRKWREVRVRPEGPDVHPEDLRTGRAPEPMTPSDLETLDSSAPKT